MSELDRKILGIIPARSGSKRVPGKNIRIVVDKPLIAYTIIEAKKSEYIDKLIVSTDSPEIAKISEKWGAEVPFLRPKNLAKDATDIIDVIIHALNYLESKENYIPDLIVLLEPTSPLRTNKDIDSALKKHIETDADSVVSVVKGDNRHPLKAKKIIKDQIYDYIFEEKKIMRSQDLPEVYFRNGAYYSVKRDILIAKKTLYGKIIRPYIMPNERSIDINEEIDLKLVELILNGKKRKKLH